MFIKVNFNSTTRKIKLADNATLDQLKAELIRCFGDKVKDMSVGYNDAESELITVTSPEDWDVCVEEFKEKNKDKPTLTITLQLFPQEDFVTIGDSRVLKTEETAPVETESEIKEEPKETKPVEELPENKIILPTESEHPPTEVHDTIVETEVKIPEQSFNNPEDLQNLIKNVTDTLGSVFGINVDVIDARVEPAVQEEPELNESNVSTLTTEQKTEIEDMIEEKIQKMLSLKKEKKCEKKHKKDKKEKKEDKKTASFVHFNIICDGCKKGIKDMARFKSLVIEDYDLCEECEKTGIHPGPMVKFTTPSNTVPFKLNHKFRELIPYFKSDFEKKEENCFEGFKFFPECPFRGGRGRFPGFHGPHHQRPHHRPHGHHGHHGFHNNPIFKNISEGLKPFGGLFSSIVQNVASEFNKHNKPAQPEPKKETMTETKPETDDFKILAEEFITEFPDMGLDVEILSSIIRENQLLSKDAVYSYLFM